MLGKLNPSDLRKNVLDVIKKRRKEVIIGAALGEDCAVFKLNGDILMTTDPITSSSKNMGSLAINISANDIASSGGEPVLAMFTIIAAEDTPNEQIKKIMSEAEETAKKLNIEIAGGHTEFSDSVKRPICSVAMIGIADNVINSRHMCPGDSILITKTAGIEATGILVNDRETELSSVLTNAEIDLAKSYINDTSVVAECKVLKKLDTTSMHDITEGGVIGALVEIFEGNEFGAQIDFESIPISALTKKLCEALKISPYDVISSGSLLFTTPSPDVAIEKLNKIGVNATEIGVVNNCGKLIGNGFGQTKILSGDDINKSKFWR